MKNLLRINKPVWRVWHDKTGMDPSSTIGAFILKSPETGQDMRVVATSFLGWDHVSISLGQPHECNRCPTWGEMDYVKRLLFHPDEAVMQIHPVESKHVSIHDYCLHLWRPHNVEIPLPPPELVA